MIDLNRIDSLTIEETTMATATITPDQDTILAEVFIAAPPARVFEAITDPKQRAQWWGVKTTTAECVRFRVTGAHSDLRVGGKWSNDGVRGDGTPFRLWGKYLEIDPPRLLVHTRTADFVGDFETIVRWELEPRDVHGLHHGGTNRMGTGTLLRVQHSGFAGHADQATGHHEGWRVSLGWLQDYLENNVTMETR
jgi:uncharacterized protein YndB with AHSA1/START domain